MLAPLNDVREDDLPVTTSAQQVTIASDELLTIKNIGTVRMPYGTTSGCLDGTLSPGEARTFNASQYIKAASVGRQSTIARVTKGQVSVPGAVASATGGSDGQVPIVQDGQFALRDPLEFDPRRWEYVHGAMGTNNTAANTACIQAALDAAAAAVVDVDDASGTAASATVKLPIGWHKVSGLTIGNNVRLIGQGDATVLMLASGSDSNLIESENFGSVDTIDRGIHIREMRLYGNRDNQTAGLCAQTYVVGDQTINGSSDSGGTLNVQDTTGFDAAGSAWVGDVLCTYTGKTSTTLTGLKRASGGSFTRHRGAWVTPLHSKGHLVALQAKRSHVRVYGNEAAGSGIFFQGVDYTAGGGAIASANVIHDGTRIDTSNRFGVEIGATATDSTIGRAEIGPTNLKGALCVRGANWRAPDLHLVGTFDTIEPIPQAILVAANSFRVGEVYFDTWPGSVIRVDTTVNDTTRINGPDIGQFEMFQCGWGGGKVGHGITCRGRAGVSTIARANFHDGEMWAPFGHCINTYPWTALVGAQDLASLTGNKLQVMSCMDFADTSDIGGTLTAGSDTLTYTGRQMSFTRVTQDAAIGDTTLHVQDTTGFDSSGKIRALAFDGGSYTAMTLTYTGKTATTFTGIPSSSTGSITAAISSSGQRGAVSQHFFTGVAGGVSSRTDESGLYATSEAPAITDWRETALAFRSFLVARHSFFNATDDWSMSNCTSGGKKMRSTGTITITNGNATGTTTHGMAEAPTVVIGCHVSNTVNGADENAWFTSSSTNVTANLQAAATGTLTFNYIAEIRT